MRALYYVYDLRNKHKIASIDMSLGGDKYAGHCDSSQSRTTIINKLHRAGIVVVAATGNSGYANRITAPACISNVVAVGFVSTYNFISDRISSFSNSSWALTFWQQAIQFTLQIQIQTPNIQPYQARQWQRRTLRAHSLY